jgi:phage tail sheath gpL-like
VADDGTQFGPGKAIVTPSMVKAEAVSAFRAWEKEGIVEGFEQFIDALIVERNALNPKRIDVLLPPDLTNALETMAVKTQYRR